MESKLFLIVFLTLFLMPFAYAQLIYSDCNVYGNCNPVLTGGINNYNNTYNNVTINNITQYANLTNVCFLNQSNNFGGNIQKVEGATGSFETYSTAMTPGSGANASFIQLTSASEDNSYIVMGRVLEGFGSLDYWHIKYDYPTHSLSIYNEVDLNAQLYINNNLNISENKIYANNVFSPTFTGNNFYSSNLIGHFAWIGNQWAFDNNITAPNICYSNGTGCSAAGNSSFNQTLTNSLYVSKSGDYMTGNLKLAGANITANVSTPAVPNYALNVNASTNFVATNQTMSQALNTTNFTISAWVYPSSYANNGFFRTYTQFANNGIEMALYSGSIRVLMNDGICNNIFVAQVTNLAAWNHVVLTYNGTTFFAYTNNVKSTAYACTTTSVKSVAINIGEYEGVPFNGSIDEVNFWNRPLNATEVAILYNSGTGVAGDITQQPWNNGLAGGWHLDSNGLNNTPDFSGNGNGLRNSTDSGLKWVTGKIAPPATIENINVVTVTSSLIASEQGITTFGNGLGRTILDGNKIVFNINGVEKCYMDSTSFTCVNVSSDFVNYYTKNQTYNKTEVYNISQIDSFNASWSSTYNATYNTYAYNQTTLYYSDEVYINKNSTNSFNLNETKLNQTIKAVAVTSPGDGVGAIQYNNGTSFAGSANLTWNETARIMNVNGNVNASNISSLRYNAPKSQDYSDGTGIYFGDADNASIQWTEGHSLGTDPYVNLVIRPDVNREGGSSYGTLHVRGNLKIGFDNSISSGIGSTVFGSNIGAGNGIMESTGPGTMAGGSVSAYGTPSYISSTGQGSIVLGKSAGYEQTCNMESNGIGSTVIGYCNSDTNNNPVNMQSTGQGSILIGSAITDYDSGGTPGDANILSSGTGSFAGGLCLSKNSLGTTGCSMTSSGYASFLWAYTNEGTSQSTGTASVAIGQNVQATTDNAFTFGKSISNGNVSSMLIGWTTPSMFINSSKIDIYKQLNVKSNLNMTSTNITDVSQLKFNVITLPTCASAYNGTMARNETKLYFCDGVTWNALY